MTLKLDDFEEQIDPIVLERAYNYYDGGRIRRVFSNGPCCYTAIVDGSETYTVEVELSSDGNTILDCSCDCPYDRGPYCKHEAAVFCYLKEHVDMCYTENAEDLECILNSLNEYELRRALKDILIRDGALCERFMLAHRDTQTMLEEADRRMAHALHSFDENKNNCEELEKTYDVIREVYNTVPDLNEPEATLRLLLLIIQKLCCLESVLDEENEEISSYEYDDWCRNVDRIYTLFFNAGQSVCEVLKKDIVNGSEEEKQYDFDLMISNYKNVDYIRHNETFCMIAESLIPYCDQPERRKRLEKLLLTYCEDPQNEESFHNTCDFSIKRVLLHLYDQYGQKEEVRALVYQNLCYSEFRSWAIEMADKAGDYQGVLELAQGGLSHIPYDSGMDPLWYRIIYETYEKLNDRAHMISFSKERLYDGDFDGYVHLKKLIAEEEWAGWLDAALERMKRIPQCNIAYLNIIKSENMQGRMVDYCLDHPEELYFMAPILEREYCGALEPLFLERFSAWYEYLPKTTKEYEEVGEEIKRYVNLFSAEKGRDVIDKLFFLYPTRRKLHEVLLPLRLKLDS